MLWQSLFLLQLLFTYGHAQTCLAEYSQCYINPTQTGCGYNANTGQGCCAQQCCPGLVCGGTSSDSIWWAGCYQPSRTAPGYFNASFCNPSTTTKPPATTPASTTTRPPTTAPATTTRPPTTAPATTTRPPTTAPATTTRPPTTAPATTTKAPTTTAPATTTRAPTTTAPATTTRAPTTTAPATTTKAPTTTARPPATCSIPVGSQCWGAGGSVCGSDPSGCCPGCCASGQCGGSTDDNQYWKGCRAAGTTGGPTTDCSSGGSTPAPGTGLAGVTTRYWDCCKPSCAWPGKASVSSPVQTCSSTGAVVDPNTQSGCDGTTPTTNAFTCTSQQPWAINSTFSLGFAAANIAGGSESSWCCACYLLTFTSTAIAGKKFLVQVTNTGGDLGNNHFDLQIPGGGLGIFTQGCPRQFGSWNGGAQYGGVSSDAECNNLPAAVQAGCHWRFSWMQAADNPSMSFYRVKCPAALTAKTGCTRTDDSSYPTVYP